MKNLITLLTAQCNLQVQPKDSILEYSKGIPLGIKSLYHVYIFQIETIDCLILETNEPSIIAIKKHLALFDKIVHIPIIVYIPNLSNSMRNYLLENRIAFATKDSFYMPQLLIHLKDIAHKRGPLKKQEKLSKLAQMILTYCLTTHIHQLEIDSCASIFQVTKMSAGRSLNELKEFNVFELKRIGRKKFYALSPTIEFKFLLSILKNPKYETVYIKENDLLMLESFLEASHTALSHYANIVATQAYYAIDKETFRKIVDNNISYSDQPYDKSFVGLEMWTFDPGLIQQKYVDPLSLYLTLKGDMNFEDTRLSNAFYELEELIKGLLRDSRSC